MKLTCCAASLVLLACHVTGFAETRVPCSQTLNLPLHARSMLVIDSKPAGLQIVATDEDTLRVSCTAPDEAARETSFHFSPTATGGKLSITGKGKNNLEVKIEVPRKTNLRVRMFAGQVTVAQVKGDKDIEIGAGQITISPIQEADYRIVDASVSIGGLHAPAFAAEKGGFFRSLTRKNSSGDYRLRAHVSTGQIELLGNAPQKQDGAKSD